MSIQLFFMKLAMKTEGHILTEVIVQIRRVWETFQKYARLLKIILLLSKYF